MYIAKSLISITNTLYYISVQKRSEISVKKVRLQLGLDKITETKRMVAVMQEELVILQPQLVRTQTEGKHVRVL